MRTEESRKELMNLIRLAGRGSLTMVEIGSYRGESASSFLSTGLVDRIFCVDPWKPFYDVDDIAAFSNMELVEKEFDSRFKKDKRVIKVKGTIDDYVQKYNNQEVDIVYVDGDHTYEGCSHDLQVVKNIIKPRIFISGHDYYNILGVKSAVDNIIGSPDLTFSDCSWLKFVDEDKESK